MMKPGIQSRIRPRLFTSLGKIDDLTREDDAIIHASLVRECLAEDKDSRLMNRLTAKRQMALLERRDRGEAWIRQWAK